jgi:drug/metabolite transporter (DMT)-like permease
VSPADGRGFRDPKVLASFIAITLIWGSTWIVIKDQLGTVPPSWSVTYRFIVASAAMFAFAWSSGAPLRMGWRGHAMAVGFGIPQFMLNFNLVYAAELYVTSGLVAVVFALLMVPNSALAWIFLKHKVTGRFILGSSIACAGVALLFVQEIRSSPVSPMAAAIGIGLTLVAVLAASAANIMQAHPRVAKRPIVVNLAWGMFYGMIANALAAFLLFGPPTVEARIGYWTGVLYLGLAASSFAFTLYFVVIRAVGPGKAAYSSLLVPVLAMGISTAVEGYRWTTLAVAGAAIALIGMIIAMTAGRTQPSSQRTR